jgi:hypothetical protein
MGRVPEAPIDITPEDHHVERWRAAGNPD